VPDDGSAILFDVSVPLRYGATSLVDVTCQKDGYLNSPRPKT